MGASVTNRKALELNIQRAGSPERLSDTTNSLSGDMNRSHAVYLVQELQHATEALNSLFTDCGSGSDIGSYIPSISSSTYLEKENHPFLVVSSTPKCNSYIQNHHVLPILPLSGGWFS